MTVSVVPDVSQIEPMILAEISRVGASIGEVERDEFADRLENVGVLDAGFVADQLLAQFVIIPRKANDASES